MENPLAGSLNGVGAQNVRALHLMVLRSVSAATAVAVTLMLEAAFIALRQILALPTSVIGNGVTSAMGFSMLVARLLDRVPDSWGATIIPTAVITRSCTTTTLAKAKAIGRNATNVNYCGLVAMVETLRIHVLPVALIATLDLAIIGSRFLTRLHFSFKRAEQVF
jgi:hypothetical protein